MCIVSFSLNFIFVKTTKTAGTSIEVFLQNYCSRKDIVTPIFPRNANHNPQNFKNSFGKQLFYNHMPMSDIKFRVSKEFFNSAFKFCFERHPVDKCLSHFAMLLNSPDHKKYDSPRDWLIYLQERNFPIDTNKYTDGNGNLLVDCVYKYEDLSYAVADILQRLNIPNNLLNIFEKSGFRKGIPTFYDVYNDIEQRRIIMEEFSETLKFVQYE